jgi:hypothetical protein
MTVRLRDTKIEGRLIDMHGATLNGHVIMETTHPSIMLRHVQVPAVEVWVIPDSEGEEEDAKILSAARLTRRAG